MRNIVNIPILKNTKPSKGVFFSKIITIIVQQILVCAGSYICLSNELCLGFKKKCISFKLPLSQAILNRGLETCHKL